MKFKIFKLPTFAFIILFGMIVHAQEQSVHRIIQEVEIAINTGNLERTMVHFNRTDSNTFADFERYFGNIQKKDTMHYSLVPNAIHIDGQSSTVIGLEKVTYQKFGRQQVDIGWRTIQLEKRKKKWNITRIDERNYLKANNVVLESNLDPENGHVQATAKIDFIILKDGENNILFHLNRGLNIDRITDEEGNDLEFERIADIVIIPWQEDLISGGEHQLEFEYSGDFFNEHKEYQYNLAYIGVEGCFANFVTNWYPKVNGIHTKSKATLKYLVPSEYMVASVGKLVREEAIAENKTIYTYNVTAQMDYTFNANRFFHYTENIEGVSVNIYLLNGGFDKAKMYAMESAKILSYLKELYGLFPYDSYNISEVPKEITMQLGGSGGQGLNFYPTHELRDDTFEFPLVAHEMGHMWWGSWVIGSKENEEIIAEGFSQMNAVFCYRHFYGEKAMWDFINDGTALYPQSATAYFMEYDESNDVALDDYDELKSVDFSRLAYVKSHFIYAMLMETVGFDTFIRGIKHIIAEYHNQKLSINNLQQVMEAESGLDLEYFFEQWFKRTGVPELALDYKIEALQNGEFQVTGTIDQLRNIYKLNAEIDFVNDSKKTTKVIAIDAKQNHFSYRLKHKPTSVILDPDRKILRWSSETMHLPEINQGVNYYFSDEFEESIKILEQYSPVDFENTIGHIILGMSYFSTEKYSKAQEIFTTIIGEYESSGKFVVDVPLAYAYLGKIHQKTGNIEEADKCFTEVLNLKDIIGTHNMANEYFADKQ